MAKFKFLHVADTHCGHSGNASRYNEYSALRITKTTEQGVNVRQDDIDKAFEQVISIAIDRKVDAVLHAGDGWDLWGYKQNHVLNTYNGQVARLSPHGIDYVEIVGNHNLPKLGGKGCHLEELALFPRVYTVFRGYEIIELFGGKVAVHCVPSSFTQEMMSEMLAAVEPIEGKINIGMSHLGVTTIKHYAEHSVNSLVTDLDTLIRCRMDYFALGDYHTPTDFGHNIRYSGSIERLGFDEIGNKPQVLIVEIDEDTKEVSVEPIYLSVRPMIELPIIDAKEVINARSESEPEGNEDDGASASRVVERLNQVIVERIKKADLKDKIVRLRVKNLPTNVKGLVNAAKMRDLTEDALYFRLELVDKVTETKGLRTSGTKIEGVIEGWGAFAKAVAEDGTFSKTRLEERGYKYLQEVLDHAAGEN